MRAVIQRVSRANVTVSGEVVGEIGAGLLVLLGVEQGDTQDDVVWMANKVVGLRVFEDDDGKMNLDVGEVGGAILAVSQFTLLGDCRKGRRPSFVAAARPEEADGLYRSFVTVALYHILVLSFCIPPHIITEINSAFLIYWFYYCIHILISIIEKGLKERNLII